MSQYTCNSCALAFENGIDQRNHMKSDWHRYNLKRRVAQLPPINEATFNEKVASFIAVPQESLSKREVRRREKEALLERKRKLLEMAKESMMKNAAEAKNTYLADVQIPKELEIQKPLETDDSLTQKDEESEESIQERLMAEKIKNKIDIPLETCLFCPKKSFPSFELNLEHMMNTHAFYIPDERYLVDKKGLVKYLSEKLGIGNICLYCSFQGRSLESVRAHMKSKSHCRISYRSEDDKLELSQFYDFSSSYGDDLVADNADDWEEIGSDEDASADEFEQQPIYHDGVELYLPTGIKVGHRSFQRFYRQNLKPERELTEGQGTVVAADTRHFAVSSYADRKQLASKKLVWQTEIKDKKLADKRAAKFVNNQPHFRDQLLQ